MEKIIEKWGEILENIKIEFDLSDVSFESWIKPLTIHHIDGSTLYLECKEQMAVSYLDKKYKTAINTVISEQTGLSVDIIFIGPNDLSNYESKKIKKETSVTSVPKNYVDDLGLKPNYTFETFVVGSNNRFAHSACLAVAESPGEIYNPLFLYGGVGLGKTHLMQSIAHFIKERNPDMKIRYVTSEDFTNEVIYAIGKNSMNSFHEKYRNLDVLLIDDIQFIIGKEATQEEFFHTFNKLRDSGKQIIISSDKPPKDMVTLEERIRSRFEWGLTADIGQPDYETRIAILHKKEESEGISLRDEVLEYIARNIKSNVRELEGALTKLIAYHKFTHNDITIEIAENELKNLINPNQKKEITIQYIFEVVCDHYQIPMDKVLAEKRGPNNISEPRMIVMYLASKLTNATQQAIASFLNRDHSTVVNGINRISEKVDINNDDKYDEKMKINIDALIKKLSPN